MGKFKESDYYKSKEHLDNIKKAGIIGNKKIQELKQNRIDNYNSNPKLCLGCKNPINYDKRFNNFCCKSCSASYNNKLRLVSEEQKIKVSLTLLNKNKNKLSNNKIIRVCLNCNKEFEVLRKLSGGISKAKYCSKECGINGMRRNVRIFLLNSIKNGTHKGWSTRKIISYPEQFFIDVFNSRNISYKFNFPVNKRKDLGLDNSANYFLDFYFEDKKIDLEIDGSQHEYRKEHDTTRDENLSKIGIYIYRIKWININSKKGKSYIKKEINKFLKFIEKYKIGV